VPKLAKTNFVFKFESHCKSIIPSCKSTGRSEAFNVNGGKKTWKSVSSWSKIWSRCLNSRNNSVILSLYWFQSMFSPVVRILFRPALLNRWAAKLLQVGREMFRDNLNIFWKKLLVDTNCIFLEKVMNYESRKCIIVAFHPIKECCHF